MLSLFKILWNCNTKLINIKEKVLLQTVNFFLYYFKYTSEVKGEKVGNSSLISQNYSKDL